MSITSRLGIVVWYRTKATISRLLRKAPPKTRFVQDLACRLPYEIVEMIIAHCDFTTLKACSLACRSWYTVTIPHIHHTISLWGDVPTGVRCGLKPLSKLYALGLTPLIREIQVFQGERGWFLPRAFRPRDLRHFSSFSRVHTLRIQRLDITRFIPELENYFAQFSPTLRAVALLEPVCKTPQELSYFLSLFPNLDDVDIQWFSPFSSSDFKSSDASTELVPFSNPTFRGRLLLHYTHPVEVWSYLIAGRGSLRFRSMDLREVGECGQILLEACADTLETLRIYTLDRLG